MRITSTRELMYLNSLRGINQCERTSCKISSTPREPLAILQVECSLPKTMLAKKFLSFEVLGTHMLQQPARACGGMRWHTAVNATIPQY